jgi:hypothetical protein
VGPRSLTGPLVQTPAGVLPVIDLTAVHTAVLAHPRPGPPPRGADTTTFGER